MNSNLMKSAVTFLLVILITTVSGCKNKEEAAPQSLAGTQQNEQTVSTPAADVPEAAPVIVDHAQIAPKDIAVSVDGKVLKKDELAKRVKAQMKLYQDKIPADKKKEIEEGLKKQLMDDFVMRTVLTNEADNKKIVATDQNIQEAISQIKENISPDKKVEEFLKENNISKGDIVLGIRIRKLVEMEAGKKIKPTAKEINKYYTENKDKFTTEESVHVRHILIKIDAEDDEKTKAGKSARIENLRKQLLEGADFVEIARKNSDCPSKENGGDLGEINKGQTVKPFEDAAFAQEINAVGPVVTTEFGHHIIQVMGRAPKKTARVEEVREQIATYLEQQKQAEAFKQLAARLRKNAIIAYYEN